MGLKGDLANFCTFVRLGDTLGVLEDEGDDSAATNKFRLFDVAK